jgi:hypothetical protein
MNRLLKNNLTNVLSLPVEEMVILFQNLCK